MPDKGAQDVSAEGAPQGRSDPGGMKIAGFPWWVWALAAGGTFAVVYFMRNRTSGTVGSTQAAGGAAGLPSSSGVTTTDPMTAAALLSAMQDLAKRLGATAVSPAPPAPSPVANPPATVPTQPWTQAATTSHVTGGSSTGRVSNSGLPDLSIPVSKVVAPATSIWTEQKARGKVGVTSGPAPVVKPVTAGLLGIAWPWNQPKASVQAKPLPVVPMPPRPTVVFTPTGPKRGGGPLTV